MFSRIAIAAAVVVGLSAGAKAQSTFDIGIGGGIGVSSTQLTVDEIAAVDLAQQGLLAGVSLGWTGRNQGFLFGVMGRYSFTDIDGKLEFDGESQKIKAKGLWEAALKLGLSPSPYVDVYGLVGWTGIDLDTFSFGGSHPNGLLLGGGVDFGLGNNWFGRLEYTYHRFDRDGFNFEEALEATTKTDLHVVRAELVYRFGQSQVERAFNQRVK